MILLIWIALCHSPAKLRTSLRISSTLVRTTLLNQCIVKKEAILENLPNLIKKSIKYLTGTNQEFVCIAMAIPTRRKNNVLYAFSRVNGHVGAFCNKHSSMHAEENLVKKLDPRLKYDLIVLRVSKTGRITCARPCRRCIDCHLSRNTNIRTVYYSDFNGNLRFENINELCNNDYKYITRGDCNIV